MSTKPLLGGSIRKLLLSEADAFRDHLLRLDKESRRLRFAHSVSDAFIEDYVGRLSGMDGLVFGFLDGGQVRGAAELRKISDTWGEAAEAALSVEQAYQGQGIGTELMGRVIRAARNRGVRRIVMSCLVDNSAVQAIARKHDAVLSFDHGGVVGNILADGPDCFSLLSEALEDRAGFILAVFDIEKRAAANAA